jgi:hypothetical protein
LTDYPIERDNLTFSDINKVTLQSKLKIDVPNINKCIQDVADVPDVPEYQM